MIAAYAEAAMFRGFEMILKGQQLVGWLHRDLVHRQYLGWQSSLQRIVTSLDLDIAFTTMS